GDPFDGTGIGLVTSPDAGRTWTDPVLLGDSRVITQIVATPHVVLAATDMGLFRSTDRAATFTTVPIATGQEAAPYVRPTAQTAEHSFVLALEAMQDAQMGPTGGKVNTSDDDGVTWTIATGFTTAVDIGRATLAAAPTDGHTVYAMAAISNSTATDDMA